jgi:hypothetical protein
LTDPSVSRWLTRRLLAATIVLAVVLRFAGLDFGRNALIPRADENVLVAGVLYALGGDPNPHYAVWGHLMHNLCSIVAAAWLAVRVFAQESGGWLQAVAEVYCEPWGVIRLCRAISALAGAATLIPTYLIARRMFHSRLVGLSSAVVLSTMFLHVRDSHFGTTDILATLTGTWALAVIMRARSHRSRGAAWRAGLWTGVALASKLSTAPLVPIFITLLVCRRRPPRGVTTAAIVLHFALGVAITGIVLQPFMLFDPVQTLFGVGGDILNPERRPFFGGIDGNVAKVMLRYYVPQALGWTVGGAAAVGAIVTALAPRHGRERLLLVPIIWMVLPLVTVHQTYLRYLDPLLPLVSILAAQAISRFTSFIPRSKVDRTVRICDWTTLGLAVACALPNLHRSIMLDLRLMREDTRGEARRWIEANVPSGSRIYWIGFGIYGPHVTMPWLHTTSQNERAVAMERLRHGLNNRVLEQCHAWKEDRAAPCYEPVAATPTGDRPEVAGYEQFPFASRHSRVPWAMAADDWGRRVGLVSDETPYHEPMARMVARYVGVGAEAVNRLSETWVVVTRLPPHTDVLGKLGPRYELVHRIEPGWHGAPDDPGNMVYDWGDAWWLPNIGIEHVDRPGVEINIFRLRP